MRYVDVEMTRIIYPQSSDVAFDVHVRLLKPACLCPKGHKRCWALAKGTPSCPSIRGMTLEQGSIAHSGGLHDELMGESRQLLFLVRD